MVFSLNSLGRSTSTTVRNRHRDRNRDSLSAFNPRRTRAIAIPIPSPRIELYAAAAVKGKEFHLVCISHRLSTAAADPGMSIVLRSVGFLDVLSITESLSSTEDLHAHRRPGLTWPLQDTPRVPGWTLHQGRRRLDVDFADGPVAKACRNPATVECGNDGFGVDAAAQR